MQRFPGIQSDTAATAEGLAYAQNVRYSLEGELQRRAGLETGTTVNGRVIANAWSPTGGVQVLLFTSSGALELVTL